MMSVENDVPENFHLMFLWLQLTSTSQGFLKTGGSFVVHQKTHEPELVTFNRNNLNVLLCGIYFAH